MVNILVTRILSKPIWEGFSLDDFSVTEHDFVSTVPCESSESPKYQNVLVSSQNAVGAFDLSQKRIFCVGTRTQLALNKQGLTVSKRSSSALEMANAAAKKAEPATFICGSKRLPIVEEVFRGIGLELQVIVVYRTLMQPREFSIKWDAILFFSPSGVESFHELNDQIPPAICIGETTAACAQTYGHPIVLSRFQTKESVVQAALDYFKS